MSFPSAPTPVQVGFPNADTTTVSAKRTPNRGSPEEDGLSFARPVRRPWWRSAWPLIVSIAFGAALLFTAGNAPPAATVQHMLHEQEEQELASAAATSWDDELPSQWQWPSISDAVGVDHRLACDPAQTVTAC